MPELNELWVDDPEEIARRDSRDTLRALASSAAQVREAVTLAREAGVDALADDERPRAVVVAALGSSRTVGDALEVLAETFAPVPVTVRRNAPLPGWVGPLDLVVAVSLSGRAPGPVSIAAEAARRGSRLLTVGAEDSPLADICRQARGVHVPVGRGRVSSRTALWSLLAPVLMGAHRAGLVDASDDALAQVADVLTSRAEACRPSSESFVNPAKLAAATLAPTVPMVLGSGAVLGVAADRAAHMLGRTARVPATSGSLPDDAFGMVACFDGPFTAGGVHSGARRADDIFADPFLDGPEQPRLGLLLLQAPHVPEARMAQVVEQQARAAGCKVTTVDVDAQHPVVALADAMLMSDYVATYLALGLGLDPGVSAHVADLRDLT